MESSSDLFALPQAKNLRPKQKEIIRAFESEANIVAKLPTGYGKTRAAAGAYALLKARGIVNRLLYIVVRRNQAMQAANGLLLDLADFGVQSQSIIVGDHAFQAEKQHRSGATDVFIVTVQSLLSSGTQSLVSRLMETGRWFVVIDEHHHYGNEGQWIECVKRLPARAQLAMSATPNRHDGSDFFPDPTISETYFDASEAGYVKRLSLHAYEYTVDAVTIDGRVIPFTTAEVVEQAGSEQPDEIDRWLALSRMRWSPKYISPLVTFPIDRIRDLFLKGVKSQMLVQAMSCSHARMICDQARVLIDEHMSVDWVGTGPHGRSQQENESVLHGFCPPKDKLTGQRPWTLDVLVNVGMAGEGLDTTDVSEIVFLTPGNLTISNYQTIGRGARVMSGSEKARETICHVNVDTASPMAAYVGKRVMELFDDGVEIAPADNDPPPPHGEGDYVPMPEHLSVVIADVRLVDILEEPMFKSIFEKTLDGVHKRLPNCTTEMATSVAKQEAEQALRAHLSRGLNESAKLAQAQQLLATAVTKLTGLVIRQVQASGVRQAGQFAGDIKKRINQKKRALYGAVEHASVENLERQYDWVKSIETECLKSGPPKWLR